MREQEVCSEKSGLGNGSSVSDSRRVMKETRQVKAPRVRQADIAKELNVSLMTVSRALRDHPDLTEETKQRVLAKAVELGYLAADRFDGRPSSRRIGFFCYDLERQILFSAPIASKIFLGVEEACRRNRVELVLEFPHHDETPLAVGNKTVDAALVFGRYIPKTLDSLKDVPALAVSSYTGGEKIACITADNAEGILATTEHLLGLGHREIAFVAPDEEPLTELYRDRSRGYRIAMGEAGFEPRVHFYPDNECLAGILEGLGPVTAIVCGCDRTALKTKALLKAAGRDVPGEISLTGFDDIEESQAEEITTFAVDWVRLGQIAAHLILFRPRDVVNDRLKFLIPGELRVRGSTAAPRGH